MSDTSVVSKIKELRKDLDKETNFLQQQMELPLNGNKERNIQSENNSMQLSKGLQFPNGLEKLPLNLSR